MTKRILLAEDEDILREQLLEILTRHRYSVDAAVDGAQALSYGESEFYDLAIIDLHPVLVAPRLPHLPAAE